MGYGIDPRRKTELELELGHAIGDSVGMENKSTAVTANLAKVCGLRAGNKLDEKLARAIANPESKWTAPFVYSRGNCAVYVSGMYLGTVGAAIEAGKWIGELAERLPEYPHVAEIARKF